MRLAMKINEERARCDRLNYVQIVLIPKKSNPIEIIDYILIILLNCSIKIIKVHSKQVRHKIARDN